MSSVVVNFPGPRAGQEAEPRCASHDAAWWFEPEMFDRAVEICGTLRDARRLPGRALQSGERLGVWGGLTPEQRAALPDAVVIPLPEPRSGGGR